MSWWRPAQRSDDEITRYVMGEVEAGRIALERAPMVERILRDEAAGKCVVMRDPKIIKRPPRKPSWG
jgi:hypothetical protein